MYSRILVAMDDSESSRHALEHAVGLAKALPASLRVIHVADMGWLPIGPEVAFDTHALMAARRDVGERIVTLARGILQAAALEPDAALVETETPTQHVAQAIAQEASRWNADLVMLGTHGRRGYQHLVLGSVAEQMARLSSRPLLLIPLPRTSPPA